MGSSNAYTECYGQTFYGILDISTPRFGKVLNISRSVDILPLKHIYFWSLCQRASDGIYVIGRGDNPDPQSTGRAQISWKHVRAQTINHIIIFLFLGLCQFIWYTVNDPWGYIINFRNRINQVRNIFVWLYWSSLPPFMASFIWVTLYSAQL